MTSKQMTMASASNLPHKIKKSERDECATGNQWKEFADSTVDRHAAPNHQHSQCNCENHVTRAGKPGNCERLRFFPMLRPRGDHKRQPMCRNGSVQESDGKTTRRNCGKNESVHCNNITTSAWPAWFFFLLNRTTPVTEPA